MSLIDKNIYLDYNSTTPIDPSVLEAMLPFLKDKFANASSSHHFGQSINEKVKQARERIADFINAESNELIYTSGATEAINIAIKGVAENYSSKGKHIITVSTEHYAVLDTCKHLETRGYEVTYLPVSRDGLIDLTELKKSIREDTILVCVMHGNNETGVIQPIKEIASIAHVAGSLFMTDVTQAVGKIKIDVDSLRIDLLCLSGHKMYAHKGIGALYVRQRINKVKLPKYIHGGGHERGVRSETLNVPGIIALAKACEIAQTEMKQDSEKITVLRDELENELLKIEGPFVNGNKENRIFNTTNICFPNVDANVLIGRMKNIDVSNGSACTSAVVEPSHVLTAMGLSEDEALGSIRFSLGRYNTKEEVISAKQLIKKLGTNQNNNA
jgi:cysteine desulfurase